VRCLKCKTYNHDKARFCINCGILLGSPVLKFSGKIRHTIIVFICTLLVLLTLIFLFFIAKQKLENDSISLSLLKLESNGKLQKISQVKAHVIADSVSCVHNQGKVVSAAQNYTDYNRDMLFEKAFLLQDSNSLASIALISKGICIPLTFSEKSIFGDFKAEVIIEKIKLLINELSKKGYGNELEEILTSNVVIDIGSIQILHYMVQIISQNSGYGSAIRFVESVRSEFDFSSESAESEIDSLTVHLYQQWLTEQIENNNIDNADSIYNFANKQFPVNPEIHIAGIHIALKQGNWEKAEELLTEINYPESLSYKIKDLENKIYELKGNIGKILIKFNPGSKYIPIQALINGKIKQDFLFDTGSSYVTVPHSTIKALGIKVNKSGSAVKVSTAGGVKLARVIILNSITIGRCSVNNIKVLVLDIPGQPNLGLLGLNFLHYFHVEINNKEGTLLLTPR